MKCYATLNADSICTGISQLSGEVDVPNMVEVESYDTDYIWRRYENGAWSAEKYPPDMPKTLDEAKAMKVAEINEACRQAIEAGFIYDDHLFKSAVDPDQTNIALAGLQFMMDPTAALPWETANNSTVITLTASTFPLFAGAFGQHKMAQQVKVAELKAQVHAATTMEAVAAVVW